MKRKRRHKNQPHPSARAGGRGYRRAGKRPRARTPGVFAALVLAGGGLWWFSHRAPVPTPENVWNRDSVTDRGRLHPLPERGPGPARRSRAGKKNEIPLADEDRVYIAEIEHRALTLSRRAFPVIAEALRSLDIKRLRGMFSESFTGASIDFALGEVPRCPGISVHRIRAPMARKRSLPGNGPGFAAFLADLVQPYLGEPRVKLRLMSLLPVKRNALDGAWYGNFELRIAGRTRTEAAREVLAVFDFLFNRIAEPDRIALEPGWIDRLAFREGQLASVREPLMAEVGHPLGIDPTLFVDNWNIPVSERGVLNGGVYLADIDNDAREEVLINDYNGFFLFKQDAKGLFYDVTASFGLPQSLRGTANVAFADFDNDGFVDLVVDDLVFRNIEGRRFVSMTGQTNLRLDRPARHLVSGYTVGDYDRDGLIDLYVSRSYGPGRSKSDSWIDGPGGPGNQLWRNLGDWRFEDVSRSANARAGHRSCFTSAFLDANNDGWPDLYVINEFGGGLLLVNRGNGTFGERHLLDDAGDFGSMGMTVGDIDNDGLIDVYAANMYSKAGRRIMENLPEGTYPPEIFAKIKRFVTGSELYRNRGDLRFERQGKTLGVHAVGWAYGPAFVDLTNNGFLDLYANAGFFSVDTKDPDG